jgi:MFS family permease
MASDGRTNVPALVVLVLMNVMMAVIQTNIASLNLPISLEFNQTLYGLGLLSSGFFVAYGLFELPGGLLAFRVGAKKLLVVGGLVTAAAALAAAASPSFDVLIALRFLAGAGLGLSFPPTVVLLIRNIRVGSTGVGASLVPTSFSIGGGIGVFGWAVLSVVLGWRGSIFLGGALCLIPTVAAVWVLPADGPLITPTRMISNMKKVIFNKEFMIVSLAFLGAGGGNTVVAGFMVYYLEQHLGLSADTAGLIGGLTYVFPIFTSPFFGRLYDKGYNEKTILLSSAALMGLGMGVAALDSAASAVVSVLAVGLATGIFFTVGFSMARDRSPVREMDSFTVGLADSFSLVGSFASPLYFSVAVLDYGYSSAWLAGGVITIALAVPLLLLKPRGTNPRGTAPGPLSHDG